jgi:hypothetical protein
MYKIKIQNNNCSTVVVEVAILLSFCELGSISRIIALYIQGLRFESRSSHLSILKVEFLTTRLLNQEKEVSILDFSF